METDSSILVSCSCSILGQRLPLGKSHLSGSQGPHLENPGEGPENLCMAGKMVVGMGARRSRNGVEVTEMGDQVISKVPTRPVLPGPPSFIPLINPPLEAASPAATSCV